MRLAVIIPAYNHLAEVMTCLNTLQALAHDPDALSWHVQDDCSPDVNYPLCIPLCSAHVQRNARNLGFAGNCNAGAHAAIPSIYQPDVLLFCNQDVQASPDWSQGWDTALLSAFADPSVGIVGARLLFPDGSVQNAGGVFDQFAQPMHRCLGWRNAHAAQCSTPCEIEWTTAAALAIRADLFQRLNGFDEGYARGYFEDVDLCLRARAEGYRVWFEPRCTLIHSVGSTGGSPYFSANARRFKQQWIDTGRVKAGTFTPQYRYW